jgi:hypothetical protein
VTAETEKFENGSPRLTLVGAPNLPEQNQLAVSAARQSDDAAENEPSPNLKTNTGGRFLRLADLPTFALDRLSRYEHLLWRQTRQIVFTLESLRRRKQQPSRSSLPFSFWRRDSNKFR